MPIPFHDVDDVDELGSAGFLKLEPLIGGEPGAVGAVAGLLVLNARGEPLEFAYNRVELRHVALWGERRARCLLQRRLVASLLSVSSYDPRLLVCLDDEIDSEVFKRELRVEVPIARLGVTDTDATWLPAPPRDDSVEYRLFARLEEHGLLREPFERASLALREVFASAVARQFEAEDA